MPMMSVPLLARRRGGEGKSGESDLVVAEVYVGVMTLRDDDQVEVGRARSCLACGVVVGSAAIGYNVEMRELLVAGEGGKDELVMGKICE